jgi:cytoskeletal protein CcmA (bactofilin family)
MSNNGNGRPVGNKKTVVDQGTAFKGSLSSSCPIVIMGKIEGEVTGPAIEVTDTGALAGKAKVSELRSRGELAGEFDADEVELAGRVRDNTIIRARSLLVAPGRSDGEPAALFGECEIQVGDAPSKEEAINEALAGTRGRPAAAPAETAPAPAPAAPEGVPVPAEPAKDASTETENTGTGRRRRPSPDRPTEGA